MKNQQAFLDTTKIKRQSSIDLQKKGVAKLNKVFNLDQKIDHEVNRQSFSHSKPSFAGSRPKTADQTRLYRNKSIGSTSTISRNKSFNDQNTKSRVKT